VQPNHVKRYTVLIASIFIQVSLGGLFAWSVFVPPLISDYSFTAAQAQAIFGITIAAFALSMQFAGRMQVRFGPRPIALIGGLLFGTGYIIASYSQGSWSLIVLGIGIISGIGIGFGYVPPLATCVKWFPKTKGLITGITVAGFGAGAIVLSQAVTALFGQGMDVLQVFRIVGTTYGAVVTLSALLLSVPVPCLEDGRSTEMAFIDLLTHPPFWRLAIGMFCGTFAGLLVVGNIKTIALSAGIPASVATLSIGTFAVGNAVGRVTWGHLSDRIDGVVVPLSLLVLCATVLFLMPASALGSVFALAALAVGFGFGANFVIYAAQVAATFGVEAVGTIYPMVFIVYGLSGITGPVAGGWLYDRTGNYTTSITVAACVAALGMFGTALLTPRRKA